jgi:hypothetical protein
MLFKSRIERELKKVNSIKESPLQADRIKLVQRDFIWLIEQLSRSEQEKIAGCQIPIVSTAVFKPCPAEFRKTHGMARVRLYKPFISSQEQQILS